MNSLGRIVLVVCLFQACAGAAPEKEAAVSDQDATVILRAVLKERGEGGWDLETRCRFLKGGGFSREEARFVIEAFNVYGKDLDRLDGQRQAILSTMTGPLSGPQTAALRDLGGQREKHLAAILRDIGQMRGGALKAKLESMLFLVKRGIHASASSCQERVARIQTYTAMSETTDGRMTGLGLTVTDAGRQHEVRVKTVLKGPGEGRALNQGPWGAESAAVVMLKASESGLFVGESEHYETCSGSNLTKLAGSTRGTKYLEPAARAALD